MFLLFFVFWFFGSSFSCDGSSSFFVLFRITFKVGLLLFDVFDCLIKISNCGGNLNLEFIEISFDVDIKSEFFVNLIFGFFSLGCLLSFGFIIFLSNWFFSISLRNNRGHLFLFPFVRFKKFLNVFRVR